MKKWETKSKQRKREVELNGGEKMGEEELKIVRVTADEIKKKRKLNKQKRRE